MGEPERSSGSGREPSAAENAVRDEARLAALRDLQILDSPADAAIDRLTALAAKLLKVPVALVSLVDSDRQFFFSQQGLPAEFAEARQTPLSHSFCQHVVNDNEPLLVEDARIESRLEKNLAIRDLDVIAYAGVPLTAQTGHTLGSFCAIDNKPRQWSDWEVDILRDLAATAEGMIALRGQLAAMGTLDRLTGLPNRNLLITYCDNLLGRQEEKKDKVAVICAGVDHFNQINQAFGTDEADLVLQKIALRMDEFASTHGMFGRLRGDVFTLVSGVKDEEEALDRARQLRNSLGAESIQVDDSSLNLGATIGVAMARQGSNGADLVSQAANAMRQAKRQQIQVHLAEDGWTEVAAKSLRLRGALAGALNNEEISVVFQPIVELETGLATGAEALVRWTNPELGSVGPDDFVPVAEATSDIIPIGEKVLETAVGQVAHWRQEGHHEFRGTINVSPLQLEQPNFAEIVGGCLERAGLPGEAIGIEITEGALLESGSIQRSNLNRLKELDCWIILDDFGTGYSALSYLRQFPIDVIKIDRSFIESMVSQRTSAALVQAILAMARGMDLDVVAEGIETSEQSHLLKLLGCRYGQGYHFSRPCSSSDIQFKYPDQDSEWAAESRRPFGQSG